MTKQPRTFSPQEKALVASAAIRGDKTVAQISSSYQVHTTQISNWKKQATDNLSELFKDNQELKNIDEQSAGDLAGVLEMFGGQVVG